MRTNLLFCILVVLFIPGCTWWNSSQKSVDTRLENHQEITVTALENPGFAYKNLEGKPRGFTYEIAHYLNQLLPSRFQISTVKSQKELILQIKKNSKSHLIFTALPEIVASQLGLAHTQPVLRSHYLLVCSKDHNATFDKIVLHPDAAESQLTHHLLPAAKIYFHNLQARDLLLKVWRNPELCTLIDEKLMSVFHLELPELRIKRRFEQTKNYAFYTSSQNLTTLARIDAALPKMKRDLTNFQDIYFGSVRNFDYADYQIFLERLEEDLSSYAKIFRRVAQKHNLPWTLLAAVAYQESHWDPSAESPTGVKGFMMLTQTTAKAMGVKNILNLEQNLEGGAKYLRTLFDQLPGSILPSDRPLFALAAYNAGQGMLQRVRIKTRTEGKNPDRWVDVAEVFPRLSEDATEPLKRVPSQVAAQPEHTFDTPKLYHSKALETLQFVQKVRFYEIFLKQREKAWQSSRQLSAQDDEPEN